MNEDTPIGARPGNDVDAGRPRWKLHTLGGVSVVDTHSNASADAIHRRRLALLAILAVAGGRGTSRDWLIALLWPESDAKSGRHSLRQALYGLRRDLGGSAIVYGTSELRLDPRHITSDVGEFISRVACGELEQASAAYGGPFLEGFHVDGSVEFGHWVDSTRQRFATAYASAVESLAHRASQDGRHAEAAGWWRRLVASDPMDSGTTLHLVDSLVAAMDPTAALRAIAAHEQRLHKELGLGLPPQLQATRRTLHGAAPPVPAARPPASARPQLTERATDPASEPPSDHVPAPPARRARVYLMAATLAACVVVAGVTRLFDSKAFANPTRVSGRVAIIPFSSSSGAPTSDAEEAGALLGMTVDGVGGLSIVETRAIRGALQASSAHPNPGREAARSVGASLFVIGRIDGTADRVHLSTSLFDTERGDTPIARAEVEGPRDSALTLPARAAALLFAPVIAGVNASFESRAATGSGSPTALRHYLQGEAAFRQAHYAEAADAFGQAVAADPAFALAYYRLSVADDWASRGDDALRAAERAAALRGNLTPHDSLRLAGLVAWRRGDYDRAELVYRTIVTAYPWDQEARYQLGEVLFHGNPPRGRSVREAQPSFEQVLASQPRNREALVHLQLLAALDRDRHRLDSLTQRIRAVVPDSESLGQLALAAYGLRDSALEGRLIGALRDRDPLTIYNLVWRVAVFTGNLDGALRLSTLLTIERWPASTRALGFGLRSLLHVAQGRPDAAAADAARAAPLLPDWAMHLRAWETTIPPVTSTSERRRALLDSLERRPFPVEARPGTWIPNYSFPAARSADNAFFRALLALSLADPVRLEATRRWIATPAHGLSGNAILRGEVDGMRAALAGRPGLAADLAQRSGPGSFPGFGATGSVRLLIGDWAAEAGDTDLGLREFATFEELDLESLSFAAVAHRRRGALLEARGDGEAALHEYQRTLELWSQCDASVRPTRDSVALRVAALSRRTVARR